MAEDNKSQVQTTKTMFGIVEALQNLDGAGISELATHLDLAKSTIHRHLQTLKNEEYIVREGNTYYLGLQFLNLGDYSRKRRNEWKMAQEQVEELALTTDERAQFLVEEHGYAAYVHRERGGHGVQTDPLLGSRLPLHSTAGGKVILAFMSEGKRTEILNRRGLEQFTNSTITDRGELIEELKAIRDQGYGFNLEENVTGLHAAGVPIRAPDGDVLGALSVSGPAHRLKGDELEVELTNLLLGVANELELNIAHSEP